MLLSSQAGEDLEEDDEDEDEDDGEPIRPGPSQPFRHGQEEVASGERQPLLSRTGSRQRRRRNSTVRGEATVTQAVLMVNDSF